jgi:NAD(P)-dependent dehydrogenase (short-subunit alcohol dehydrogenase family)
MNDFSGKNIVVTGAASGIGAAVVRRTLELGAQVIGLDINQAIGELTTCILMRAFRSRRPRRRSRSINSAQ